MNAPLPDVVVPERYTYMTAFLTMRCGLRCPYCLNALYGSFNRDAFPELPGTAWVRALNRLVARPGVPVTFTGGEPFLHCAFIDILNGLKPELGIDILTNLQWGHVGLERFMAAVNPRRIARPAPYASIRVSYHPEQMGEGDELLTAMTRLQGAGFSVGLYAVLYPSSAHLRAISRMELMCREAGIDFRVKEFLGRYGSETYGGHSRFPLSAFQERTRSCQCRIAELLIGTDGHVYRCHRDLYGAERPVGSLLDPTFAIDDRFRPCDRYGECHPCDVKTKTDYRQQPGYCSVEITSIH